MTSSRHRILAGVVGLALLSPASACSSASGTDSGSAAGRPAAESAVEACTLLKKDEVQGVIGANAGGGPGAGVGESVCQWENEGNAHSITVSIGTAGTAVDGELPEEEALPGAGTAEAGPDGIRFAADNTGTFVIADRVCYVQVVTDVTSNKDRDTAVRLIRLVRARTEGKL